MRKPDSPLVVITEEDFPWSDTGEMMDEIKTTDPSAAEVVGEPGLPVMPTYKEPLRSLGWDCPASDDETMDAIQDAPWISPLLAARQGIEDEVTEYLPGTYCKDTQCKYHHAGQFDTHCNSCSAYLFYLWLQEHGYRLLKQEGRTS